MIANLILELCESQVRRGKKKKGGMEEEWRQRNRTLEQNYTRKKSNTWLFLLLGSCLSSLLMGTFDKSASFKYSIFLSDFFDVALRSIRQSRSNFFCLNYVTLQPVWWMWDCWFVPTHKESFILNEKVFNTFSQSDAEAALSGERSMTTV